MKKIEREVEEGIVKEGSWAAMILLIVALGLGALFIILGIISLVKLIF
jgi:hypothetical protein